MNFSNKIGANIYRQNDRYDERNRIGEFRWTRKKDDVDVVSYTGSENPIDYHQGIMQRLLSSGLFAPVKIILNSLCNRITYRQETSQNNRFY